VGAIKSRAAWDLGDYSCDSYLPELGAAQRRERRKSVLQGVESPVSRVGDESPGYLEELGTRIHFTERLFKMIKWILKLLKPLKQGPAEKVIREEAHKRIRSLSTQVNQAAGNISSLTEQLKKRAK